MWADNIAKQDLLGYQVHADLLQKIILDDDMLPISIGVFGNWGSGKSTLMYLLQNGIEQWKLSTSSASSSSKSKVLQICFNSWQFESYDSTKLTMIDTILDAIQSDINDNKDFFEKADDFFARIKYLKAGILILKKAYENLTPQIIKKWMPSEEELDKITGKDEYKKLVDEVSEGNTSKVIETFRKIFEGLIEDAGYKAVVVYIDDLDRCDPKRIIECLEAVKLFVNVERTAFIIGADERIIEYAIKLHYPIEQDKEEISSPFSDYLEKLIQLPYKLPKLSDNEQETYITLLLCKQHLTSTDFEKVFMQYLDFRKRDKHSKFNIEDLKTLNSEVNFTSIEYMLPIVPLMKQFLNGNPRQLKRFLNTLYVRRELAIVAGFDNICPDVLVKLMVLEYNTLFNTRFEELYRIQKQNGGILPIEDAEREALSETGIQAPQWKDNWSSDYLKRWLASQPSLKDINLQDYFWVARDALKNERPIASLVTNKINLLYKDLQRIQLDRAMKKRLPESVSTLSDEEKEMLIMLLNRELIANPASANCWRILNNDEGNLIIESSLDRISSLLDHVNTDKIAPQASIFILRMKGVSEEIRLFIDRLNFSTHLNNAIARQEKPKN